MDSIIALGILLLAYVIGMPLLALVKAGAARRSADQLEATLTYLTGEMAVLRRQLRELETPTTSTRSTPAPDAPSRDSGQAARPNMAAKADFSMRGVLAASPVMARQPVSPVAPVSSPSTAAAEPTPRPPARSDPDPAVTPPIDIPTAEAEAADPIIAATADQTSERANGDAPSMQSAEMPADSAPDQSAAAPPRPTAPRPDWFAKAKDWLLGGNLVAKMGLLILFIGVSFLLKYVAAQITVPIELRLAGVALADIGMLVWAWRIRRARPGISLPVQGAALAILMLVTFGAFRLYHLMPSSMAFALLLILTAFTCLLAVLQNAAWLATFGIVGGFAAPLLASSGGGSHIGLFTYYAVLNAGVLAIALKRSWRMLNLLGFGFTFVIGTAWGVLKYTADDYLSAQLFLILFFVFYVVIAVAYAARQAPRLAHYVDATLVFGTPLLAMGLQAGLVKSMDFGLAFSALAMGLFYTVLAMLLWRRQSGKFALLAQSFLALGIGFGTLALPFALDGRWTSAAWALEGAAMVWVGLRQRQPLAWVFGLLVQCGAWFYFIAAVFGLDGARGQNANVWLGFLILSATAFFMAITFRGSAGASRSDLSPLSVLFLAGAAFWLLVGTWMEITLHTSGGTMLNLLMLSALAMAAGLGLIARRMQWRFASYYAVAVQALVGVVFGLVLWRRDPFISLSLLEGALPSALMAAGGLFISAWLFARQTSRVNGGEPTLGRLALVILLWAGLTWHGPVLTIFSDWAARRYWVGADDFSYVTVYLSDSLPFYVMAVAVTAPAFAWLARRLGWPALRWFSAAVWVALAAISAYILALQYGQDAPPDPAAWAALVAAWLAGEYLLRLWPARGWPIGRRVMKALHAVRTGAPWLMIWPAGGALIAGWLQPAAEQGALLAQAGWYASAGWSRLVPAWAMMLVVALLIRRCRENEDGWPLAPLASWYRHCLIPLGTAWSLALVAVWNLGSNGSTAPLPYLPLLNPLDLSTGFAALLTVASARLLRDEMACWPVWRGRLPLLAGCALYLWLNLMLLRTVANYGDIAYRFDALFASRFVQAMLSLVWSATALILMRHAAGRRNRTQWSLGAMLLGLVVLKLFAVDLSNAGGIERIVSFVGVGLLMLAIGYLAPFPTIATIATNPTVPTADETPPPAAAPL
ncbi:MAG: DUF2339 domain-containing protein [Pseudomonadota bacterium]